MARRAYKRRRTRKSARSSKKRRYARRYKKKAKTSTGKLWKYVKKATKSEVKRCDAFYPANWTYTNSQPTGTYSQIFPRESKFLVRMIFRNNGVSTSSSYPLHDPWNYDGTWRYWCPYQLEFNIAKGEFANQRIGDKIYAKYINFKIHYWCRNTDDYPHYSSLYFVEIKRSVSGTYTPDNVLQSLWDGIANFCRDGHQTEIYDTALSAQDYATYRILMGESYCNKRKKYLKGIKIRKLHSSHANLVEQAFPNYKDEGQPGFTLAGTPTGNAWTGTVSAAADITKRSTFVPQAGSLLFAQPKNINNFKSKLVPINREWKYNVIGESTDQQLEEYKYYLVAICSDYKLGTDQHDMRYYVSGELVYTDK